MQSRVSVLLIALAALPLSLGAQATAAERAATRSSRAPIEDLRPPPRIVPAEKNLEEIAESERDLIDTCPRLIGDLLVVELDADVQDRLVDDAEGPGADVVGRIRGEASGLQRSGRQIAAMQANKSFPPRTGTPAQRVVEASTQQKPR